MNRKGKKQMRGKKEGNPFTLDFGREPDEVIPRLSAMEDLIHAFTSEKPTQHISLVTGVRGSGKTVFMTTFAKRIAEDDHWIAVELSPEQDLLKMLVARLGNDRKLGKILQHAEINLSYFGISLKVEGSGMQITDPSIALSRILESMKKHQKRLLITIDEVVSNQNMRIFASEFQILLRKDLPIFLLMTGLFENIRALQNEKTLTFLYRAPRLALPPLNFGIIADRYQHIFQLDREEAIQMARKTCGYSFAFQVLGYFTWQYPSDPQQVRMMYKQYLEEYVYEKIWAEMSTGDRRVAGAIAQVPDGSVKEIRKLLEMETNQFNPYRIRLIRKGIANGDEYGKLKFALPLFDEFVKENTLL